MSYNPKLGVKYSEAIHELRHKLRAEMHFREATGKPNHHLHFIVKDFVNKYGEYGGEIAYSQLNQWSNVLEVGLGKLSAGEEDPVAEEVLSEVYGVLDALAGWCAPVCRIGSGNYGRLRGTKVEYVVFDELADI